jgi:hypothetical protein
MFKKFITISALSLIISVSTLSCTSSSAQNRELSQNEASELSAKADEVSELSEFYFNADNVIEMFDYKGSYYIVYDDIDAAFENAIIRVDVETYDLIGAQKASMNGKIYGYLCENPEYSDAMTYSYMTEDYHDNVK